MASFSPLSFDTETLLRYIVDCHKVVLPVFVSYANQMHVNETTIPWCQRRTHLSLANVLPFINNTEHGKCNPPVTDMFRNICLSHHVVFVVDSDSFKMDDDVRLLDSTFIHTGSVTMELCGKLLSGSFVRQSGDNFKGIPRVYGCMLELFNYFGIFLDETLLKKCINLAH